MRQLSGDEVRRLSDLPLTYPEVGTTVDPVLPQGYRVIQRERRCSGSADFEAARTALFAWALHERAGLVVEASGPVAAGAVVRLGARRVQDRVTDRYLRALD